MWLTHSIFKMRIELKISSLLILLMLPALMFSQSYYKVKQDPVSTRSFNEICPVMTFDGLIFCSDKTEASTKTYTDPEGHSFYNIYIARKNEDGSFKKPEIYDENLTTLQHDGPVSFNFNEDQIVFSRNFELTSFGNNKKGNPNVGLYFAELVDGKWTNIVEFEYNDPNAQTSHPSISADGTTLYFSSNREGGFGGWDLYVSKKQSGRWSEPQNLGPVINTSNDEIYPFLHSSGRLYFSSNGHDRIGGFDIFYSDLINGKWYMPIKLPPPFNSGLNDFTFYADKDFETGYFTTNRRGSLDIYSFNSTLPTFDICRKQVENNYCYVFFEENTIMLDSTVYIYEWDMGDNNKVRAVEAEHCYSGPGNYLVQLNVVDKLTNLVEFNQAEYLVEVKKVIQPYITCPDTIYINQATQFQGLESYFGDVVPGEYYWDFGDGNKSVGASVVHTYIVPGNYQVKLGVMEDSANPETIRRFCSYKSIVVKEPN
jgi:PKD domain/WD40-like Beta Propeller Repeat